MKTVIEKGQYVANCDMPIKYTFQLGGGIKGRTIKKGETVTVIGQMTDIDTVSVSTLECLNRINAAYFKANFSPL